MSKKPSAKPGGFKKKFGPKSGSKKPGAKKMGVKINVKSKSKGVKKPIVKKKGTPAPAPAPHHEEEHHVEVHHEEEHHVEEHHDVEYHHEEEHHDIEYHHEEEHHEDYPHHEEEYHDVEEHHEIEYHHEEEHVPTRREPRRSTRPTSNISSRTGGTGNMDHDSAIESLERRIKELEGDLRRERERSSSERKEKDILRVRVKELEGIIESMKHHNSNGESKEEGDEDILLTGSRRDSGAWEELSTLKDVLQSELDESRERLHAAELRCEELDGMVNNLHLRAEMAEQKAHDAMSKRDAVIAGEDEVGLKRQLLKAKREREKALKLVIHLIGKERLSEHLRHNVATDDLLDSIIRAFGSPGGRGRRGGGGGHHSGGPPPEDMMMNSPRKTHSRRVPARLSP